MELASQYFLWEPPDRSITVYLAFSVIDEIHQAVAQVAAAAPMRGAEMGGLLLGKAQPGKRFTVWIDHFEPAPCSYPRGASWLLTEEEQDEFGDWLAAHPAGQVVGFVRTHTRKDLFLSDDDWGFASRFFAEPSQVLLLVKPFTTRASVGGFFFWENGTIQRERSHREFPFDRRELGSGDPLPAVVQRPEKWMPTEPLEAGETSFPESVPAARVGTRWKPGMIAVGLVVTVGALGGYLWYARSGSAAGRYTPPVTAAAVEPARQEQVRASIPQPAALNLSASESANAITITWDGRVPERRAARQGILGIADGGFQKAITLTPEQLRIGRLIYSRPVATGDLVSFRLNIETSEGASLQDAVAFIPRDPVRPAHAWRVPEKVPRQVFSEASAYPAPLPVAKPEPPKAEAVPPLKLVRPAPRREP